MCDQKWIDFFHQLDFAISNLVWQTIYNGVCSSLHDILGDFVVLVLVTNSIFDFFFNDIFGNIDQDVFSLITDLLMLDHVCDYINKLWYAFFFDLVFRYVFNLIFYDVFDSIYNDFFALIGNFTDYIVPETGTNLSHGAQCNQSCNPHFNN